MASHCSFFVVIVLMILISKSKGATTASGYSECEYFIDYFPDFPLNSSLVPSLDAYCLEWYNMDVTSQTPANTPPWCANPCQSLYMLYSKCIGQYYADLVASYYCGSYQNIICSSYDNYTYIYEVYESCNSSTSCSDSCLLATMALENYSGCCDSDTLNGPNVLCGRQAVARCPVYAIASGYLRIQFSFIVLVLSLTFAMTFF